MDSTTPFGDWIKQRRKALDLTRQDLARCAGCSPSTILKIEAGERRPSRQLTTLLLGCLEVSPEELPGLMRLARRRSDTNGHSGPASHTNSLYESVKATEQVGEARQQPPPNNLPAQLTRLIGREQAAAELSGYLLNEDIRLLTLTGPPGVGKTRLGLQVATQMLAHFPDGVFFVALASLRDPDLLANAIFQAVGGKDETNQSLHALLVETLQDKKALLLLDNFEQIVAAAPLLVRLLEECPQLKVLVTSREPLHVRGEQQFAVAPLELPDVNNLPPMSALSRYPAIALFVDRARTVNPEFVLHEENATAVAAVCVRLDGLPLAIELIAARSKMLPPSALLARLTTDQGFTSLRLLTGGAHDLPARHQALRAAIDWSYDLLDQKEQLLFTRLGVFTGGFTLAAVEAICNPRSELGEDAVDILDSLLNKSLVKIGEQGKGEEETEPRFAMLETIHEYALKRLTVDGELEQLQDLHISYYLTLAESANTHLVGPEQALWLNRLERDHDNLRAVISRALSRGDVEIAARLNGALLRFWLAHAHYNEGRKWLEQVLAQREYLPLPLLGKLLNGSAVLAAVQGDHARAADLHREGLALHRQTGDKSGIANSLNNLGILSRHMGNFEQATAFFEESLSLCRELQDESRVAMLLGNLGVTLLDQGDITQAELLLGESLILCRQLGNKGGVVTALGKLAEVAQHRGDYGKMRAQYVEFVGLVDELGGNLSVTKALEACAAAELAEGRPERAARLLGSVDALLTSTGTPMQPVDQARYRTFIDDAQSRLGKADFAEAWSRGHEMTREQAIAYALEISDRTT